MLCFVVQLGVLCSCSVGYVVQMGGHIVVVVVVLFSWAGPMLCRCSLRRVLQMGRTCFAVR